MRLPKKITAKNRLSPGLDRNRHSVRSTRNANQTNFPGENPEIAIKNRAAFADDFMLEHSRSSLCTVLVADADSSGGAPQKAQQSSECFGFPS
jgi:hypothetical protein